ncbi:gliding motility-associated C-terminal domain-containing protein [Chryseobacterium camelliae]|uniref:Gliding motility-associated C-terminal domain-containing protein n=1 Tax=Chryseobacterium camelliae TaxID=1265445 RepID=A0ABY7QIP6_9FLAO|nr:gliding motility-associated C-terminal domain-containing protein [Chryseobacterium camelliae]WBV59537.1 gliding motility-associated C-terminal domain-containing protein [Chryseobacterium camelliae]
MNKTLLSYLSIILLCISGNLLSQTYQLTGNPVNTAGWSLVSPAVINTDFVQLTSDTNNQSGSIRLNEPINLKYCDKWRVEFDFRMDSNQTYNGDGIAFWYLANPPVTSVLGSGIGVSQNAVGLIVAFDTFNNSTGSSGMSKVHVAYGLVQNTTDTNNVEFFNTPGSSFHSADLNATQPFQGTTYKHVEVSGQIDPAAPANWIIKITLDGTVICNQSFAPSGAAAAMTQGYFGFSASTGGARSRHSIKNAKIYMDKVALNKTTVTDTFCPNPTTGYASVNLTSYNNQFVTNPANYTFSYVVGGVPVTNPTNYQFNANTTVNVIVRDNSAILCDNPDGKIQLTLSPFTANNVTLSECNNNNATTATFNLNSAAVTGVPGVVKKYYRTLADLTAGVNEITTPNAYVSAPGKVYVKVTTPQGCTGNAEITLSFLPLPVSNDASLQSCFIEENPATALFNLEAANVSTEAGITKKYYITLTDALNETNPITNPSVYISGNAEVYVRIKGQNSCYIIKKIRLTVISPVTSSVLKDKTICIDDKTTLDAGPGFASYEWSTGETSQAIQNVAVGIYWVKLKTGNCITKQIVRVNAAADPVITSLDIINNTITVNVSGGRAPYQYSLDGIKWQDSNIFTGLPRGENKIFVKDFYNCEPIQIQVTVPNLINAITPNGDNVNDFIDYSALAYKKNLSFVVYDRYGNKKFEADKIRNYKWDGTSGGKKLTTGTYWFTISWNENDKNNTQTKYSGWVLVKNRE